MREGSWRVELHRRAIKDLKRLPKTIVNRAWLAIESLEIDPLPHGCKPVQGAESLYRIRIGNYRIVYRIVGDRVLVLVLRVAHRKDIYRDL